MVITATAGSSCGGWETNEQTALEIKAARNSQPIGGIG
jgi:hypothetical protein